MKKFNLTQIVALLEADPALAAKLLTPTALLGLMKLYTQYQQDAADGYISPAEGFGLAASVLTLLKVAGVTLDDLSALLPALQPLFVTAPGK